MRVVKLNWKTYHTAMGSLHLHTGPDVEYIDVEVEGLEYPGQSPAMRKETSRRMKRNNPMKRPEVAAKLSKALRGRPAGNKILSTFIKVCKQCGKKEEKRDINDNRIGVFCGKGCAAIWTNTHRTRKKGYTFERKKETKPRNFVHQRFVNHVRNYE